MKDTLIHLLNFSSVNCSWNNRIRSFIPSNIIGFGGENSIFFRWSSGSSISASLSFSNIWKHSESLIALLFLIWALIGPFTTRSRTWSSPVIFGGKNATSIIVSVITSFTLLVLWLPQLLHHSINLTNRCLIGFITNSNHTTVIRVAIPDVADTQVDRRLQAELSVK